MKSAFSLNRYLLATLIPAAVFGTAVVLAFSKIAAQHPEVYSAATYDLILTTPLLAYFISKRRLPKWLIGLMVTTGIITAWFIIPKEHQQQLNFIRFLILPLVESFILGSVIYFVVRTVRNIRGNPDYHTAILESAEKATKSKRAGIFIGTEFAMLYYALFTWKKASFTTEEYSSHRTSGITAVYGGVLLVLAGELVAVHFLLMRWSTLLAWIISAGSLYSMLLLFGWIKAALRRPVTFDQNAITIRCGLAPAFSIPFSEIEHIELSEKSPEINKGVYRQALLGDMEPHNTIIHMKQAVTCKTLYGKKKNCHMLLLHIDRKEAFYEAVKCRLGRNETV